MLVAYQICETKSVQHEKHLLLRLDMYHHPTILQLNVDGLTSSKIDIIEHLAQNRTVVILLQETSGVITGGARGGLPPLDT